MQELKDSMAKKVFFAYCWHMRFTFFPCWQVLMVRATQTLKESKDLIFDENGKSNLIIYATIICIGCTWLYNFLYIFLHLPYVASLHRGASSFRINRSFFDWAYAIPVLASLSWSETNALILKESVMGHEWYISISIRANIIYQLVFLSGLLHV